MNTEPRQISRQLIDLFGKLRGIMMVVGFAGLLLLGSMSCKNKNKSATSSETSGQKQNAETKKQHSTKSRMEGDSVSRKTVKRNQMKEVEMARAGAKRAAGGNQNYVPPRLREGTEMNREDYDSTKANPFKKVKDHPLSTFSIDVDTASYANTRRFLNNNRLPQPDAVRIEELINYFNYDYPQPEGKHPFSITTELSHCPWKPSHRLLHVGLQGKEIQRENIPPSNLVFLVDVSGSMSSRNKLPLLKKSLNLLVDKIRPKDTISMVVYSGDSGVALEPTSGENKAKIKRAIKQLRSGGSTAGSKGIKLAYEKAQENFIEDGNNRVILATDGDFNVGVTSDGALVRLIEEKRESGIFLSVLGFGQGNYQGGKMEKLSNKGNGNYAYIDSILEAKKTLVEEFGGSMMTIAKDVKVQIEMNPALVKSYRLIGYVNRQLDKEDFKDDTKDAGELGSGHSVTALYQIVPPGENTEHEPSDAPDLKYQDKQVKKEAETSGEIGTVKFRYKKPDGDESILITDPVKSGVTSEPTANFHWSAAVAMFGMELRGDQYKGKTSYDLIRETAKSALGDNPSDYREEFMRLLEKAETLEDAEGGGQ